MWQKGQRSVKKVKQATGIMESVGEGQRGVTEGQTGDYMFMLPQIFYRKTFTQNLVNSCIL